MDTSDSDDRRSMSTSSSARAYNVPGSNTSPNQRDLRIQAARRNIAEHRAAAAAAATTGSMTATTVHDADETDTDEGRQPARAPTRPELARIFTESADLHPSKHKEGAQTASKNASDAIFAQLQVLQTLQVRIMFTNNT